MAAVLVIALSAGLASGCASSKGKGKVAKEIQNLPAGLVADTEKANHTDQTLEGGDNAGAGE
jgi:hypothetical protein